MSKFKVGDRITYKTINFEVDRNSVDMSKWTVEKRGFIYKSGEIISINGSVIESSCHDQTVNDILFENEDIKLDVRYYREERLKKLLNK